MTTIPPVYDSRIPHLAADGAVEALVGVRAEREVVLKNVKHPRRLREDEHLATLGLPGFATREVRAWACLVTCCNCLDSSLAHSLAFTLPRLQLVTRNHFLNCNYSLDC